MSVQDGGPLNFTGVLPALRFGAVAGGAAGTPLDVLGIKTTDYLVQVLDTSAGLEYGDEFEIQNDNFIVIPVGGSDTTGATLLVIWYAADLAAPGFEETTSGYAGPPLLPGGTP